jgi:hypothetical protein
MVVKDTEIGFTKLQATGNDFVSIDLAGPAAPDRDR